MRTRSLALAVALAAVIASCTTTSDNPVTTTTSSGPVATTSATLPEYQSFEVRPGINAPLTTANIWALYGQTASVYDALVLQGQPASLYSSVPPTHTQVPVLADPSTPPAGEADGDSWIVDVGLHDDFAWSDGEPVTAEDIVFTFETVRDLGLDGSFNLLWPIAGTDNPGAGLVNVEALDTHTVRFIWDRQPGLARWQHGVAYAPILPHHHWAPLVAGASSPEALYELDGAGAPGFGSTVTAAHDPGVSILNSGNEAYPYRGSQLTVYVNGAVEFSSPVLGVNTFGPEPQGEPAAAYSEEFSISSMAFSVYLNRDVAGAGLIDGAITVWANPLPMWPDFGSLRRRFTVAGGITNVTLGGSTLYYLGFNTRRFPGNDLAFRQAIDCMLHKNFITEVYMADAVDNVDSTVLSTSSSWHDPSVQSTCAGQSKGEKMRAAVQILKDGGWSWDREPEFDPDGDAGFGDVRPGEGLKGPGGREIPPIAMNTAASGYDPVRATYSFWVQVFINELGVPVRAVPTDFHSLHDGIVALDWDLYISGWALGDVVPTHLVSLFHSSQDLSSGGANTTGYDSPVFDALAEEFLNATDVGQAQELGFELQRLIAEEVPIVALYTTDLHYSYRKAPDSPFPDLIYLMNKGVGGLPGLIKRN